MGMKLLIATALLYNWQLKIGIADRFCEKPFFSRKSVFLKLKKPTKFTFRFLIKFAS